MSPSPPSERPRTGMLRPQLDEGTQLTVSDHNRTVAGLTYVYPVASRRAGGVSIGINLNPNQACNWRCVYCQVPDLQRGGPPPIDLERLRSEFHGFLDQVQSGDFMVRHVPEGMRVLRDVAFSGDGEPTMAREFPDALQVVGEVLAGHGLLGSLKVVVISNGSMAMGKRVQHGFELLKELGGEVWFKLDRGTPADMALTNDVVVTIPGVLNRLRATALRVPVWIQSCWFQRDGALPTEVAVAAWLQLLQRALDEGIVLQGVLLYSLARPSFQPEAASLASVPTEWLEALGQRVAALGLAVRVTP